MQNKFLQPGIFSDEWTHEVFNHRNQAYGAFQLRHRYTQNISKAFLISVTVVATFLTLYFLMQHADNIKISDDWLVEPSLPNVLIEKPVHPIIHPPSNQHQIEKGLLVITKDTTAVDTTHIEQHHENTNQGNGKDSTATKSKGNNTGNKISDNGDSKKGKGESKDSVMKWVQEMPEFPGGMDGLNKFISKKIRTNSLWRENGLEGKVVYQFIVGRDGNVRDIKIMKDGVSFGIAELNLSVFDEMPQWKAGKNNGHPVSVIYFLPVIFIKE